jgi:hypothetical protein
MLCRLKIWEGSFSEEGVMIDIACRHWVGI